MVMALALVMNSGFAQAGPSIDEARLRRSLENIHARTTNAPQPSNDAAWSNFVSFTAEIMFGIAVTSLPPGRMFSRGGSISSARLGAALAAIVGVTGAWVIVQHALRAKRAGRVRELVKSSTSPEVLVHFFNLGLREQFGIAAQDPGLAKLVDEISDAYDLIDRQRSTTTYSVAR